MDLITKMEQLQYGDGVLQKPIVSMSQLTELKRKFEAVQYLLKAGIRRRLLQKIQVDILKRILPENRSSHSAVKMMKRIQENHSKMVSVHDELWRKLNGETLEKITRELQKRIREDHERFDTIHQQLLRDASPKSSIKKRVKRFFGFR
uniref:Uncharacterized protein n=1 Tax=Magallana gigas TaxID=29159 RepID=K1Q3A9_MAGGI